MFGFGLRLSSRIGVLAVSAGLVLGTAGCVSVVAAPGSDKLRLTTNAADVSTCTAVGNIKMDARAPGNDVLFRNRAVGLGGNVVLVTVKAFDDPMEGIAYRCP